MATAGSPTPAVNNWIYIKDVPETVTEEALKGSFATFGAIKTVNFSAGRPHQFIEFNDAGAVSRATQTQVCGFQKVN